MRRSSLARRKRLLSLEEGIFLLNASSIPIVPPEIIASTKNALPVAAPLPNAKAEKLAETILASSRWRVVPVVVRRLARIRENF
jgi:hypothetical protein